MASYFKIFIYLSLTLFSSLTYSLSDNYKSLVAHQYKLSDYNDFKFLNVKGYLQTTDYTCGSADIMALLHYYHLLSDKDMNANTEMKIAKELGTNTKNGTSPQQMVRWLTDHGFDVSYGENGTLEMLLNNLKNGIPTIIEWIDWGGHWVTVSGYYKASNDYREGKDLIILSDSGAVKNLVNPIEGMRAVESNRFNSMWFDAQYFNPGHIIRGIYIVAVPKKRYTSRSY